MVAGVETLPIIYITKADNAGEENTKKKYITSRPVYFIFFEIRGIASAFSFFYILIQSSYFFFRISHASFFFLS